MRPTNLQAINQSFSEQAAGFESERLAFSKAGYLDHLVEAVSPAATDRLLEVAAGTCACGRAFAPRVRSVVCLDATDAMLRVGQEAAEEAGLANMTFVRGFAEDLPFLDGSFDLVLSRLAFHHFAEVRPPFAEMARVLRPGGRLVLIDMEAAEEGLRATQDRIETLRDPSHVRSLSRQEMLDLFAGAGLAVEQCEATPIRQHLGSWMGLTRTPEGARAEIAQLMRADLAGGDATGFYPYELGGEVCFDQRWVLVVGRK